MKDFYWQNIKKKFKKNYHFNTKSKKKDYTTSVHEKSACLILDDFLSLYKNSLSGI